MWEPFETHDAWFHLSLYSSPPFCDVSMISKEHQFLFSSLATIAPTTSNNLDTTSSTEDQSIITIKTDAHQDTIPATSAISPSRSTRTTTASATATPIVDFITTTSAPLGNGTDNETIACYMRVRVISANEIILSHFVDNTTQGIGNSTETCNNTVWLAISYQGPLPPALHIPNDFTFDTVIPNRF